jgi:hypothetical protein
MEAGDLEDQPYFRCFVRNISEKSFEGIDWPQNSLDDLNQFATKGIRVARTIGNEFAVVPSETAAGDRIVLLTGCYDLPLIGKVEEHYIYVSRVGFAGEIIEKRNDEHKAGRTELEYIEPIGGCKLYWYCQFTKTIFDLRPIQCEVSRLSLLHLLLQF